MATRKRSGLGNGLGSLIPSNQRETKDSPVDVFFSGGAEKSKEETKEAVVEKKVETKQAKKPVQKPKKKDAIEEVAPLASPVENDLKDETEELVEVPGVTYGESTLPLLFLTLASREPCLMKMSKLN